MPNERYIRFNSTDTSHPSFNTKHDGLGEIPLELYEGNFSASGTVGHSQAFLWLQAPQVYRSIRNSSNNERYQSYCVSVPWVKIRWNLPLWGLQSLFALQNWSSIDNLHLGWPFITAHILESQYCLESEQGKNTAHCKRSRILLNMIS